MPELRDGQPRRFGRSPRRRVVPFGWDDPVYRKQHPKGSRIALFVACGHPSTDLPAETRFSSKVGHRRLICENRDPIDQMEAVVSPFQRPRVSSPRNAGFVVSTPNPCCIYVNRNAERARVRCGSLRRTRLGSLRPSYCVRQSATAPGLRRWCGVSIAAAVCRWWFPRRSPSAKGV